jgi:hypothetical protein
VFTYGVAFYAVSALRILLGNASFWFTALLLASARVIIIFLLTYSAGKKPRKATTVAVLIEPQLWWAGGSACGVRQLQLQGRHGAYVRYPPCSKFAHALISLHERHLYQYNELCDIHIFGAVFSSK